MESGYYSEMENLESAPPHAPDTPSPYNQGLLQRTRTGRSRPSATGRRKREFISDEKKDASYWEKRRKNNEAAKRSREKRRISDMVLENRVLALNEENVRLKSELLALKLRFGLITTAAYTEKSRQLAGSAVGPYYTTYSNSSTVLLQSDSSENEHSSQRSGLAPMSKYSPRGSLSDVSDGSLSAGNSPEPTIQGDIRQDDNSMDRDLMKDMKDVMNVQVTFGESMSLLRSYDDIEFISYKEPVKYNFVARDIIQYGAQGCVETVDSHPTQREDFRLLSSVPQAHGSHRVDCPPRVGGGAAATPSDVTRQYGHEPLAVGARKEPGQCRPRDCAVEPCWGPAYEHLVIERLQHTDPRQNEAGEHTADQNPDEIPQHSLSQSFTPENQEPLECSLTPCSVIEAPRVFDQGLLAHSNVTADKVSDGTLSEGSDSDSQDKVDRPGYDTAAHSDSPQMLKRTALPHKLRLKVRAIQGGEQDNGQDHSRHVRGQGASLTPCNGSHHNGCIVKSYAAAHGKRDLWSESGPLDVKASQCQPGVLSQFEQHTPKGSNNLQSDQTTSKDPDHHTVNVACFKAFGVKAAQSAETSPGHEGYNLTSPIQDQNMAKLGCRAVK
ncbi:uncharacterized protein LOC127584976 [Pristis pectinata]|uniref:uncharacterized protein LOC127584976 n=1 Tax=Pristis pectinata TaxID=685728 RepID=UPI00223CD800|nr:uncharacterized protein LOC127584976 [Pristis pectinata]XP_051898020.1 uncharacterized protein LOC127584976 [Pristis pectinata]